MQGNFLTSGGNTVVISSTGSALAGGITDNGDGTYTATLTNTVIETVTINGTLGGVAITDTTTVTFVFGNAGSALETLISATPTSLTADGISVSTITIQAKDASSINLSSGGLTIALSNDGSATIESVIDNGDGTYTATMTNTIAEIVTISGTLNSVPINDTASVTFTTGAATVTQTAITVAAISVPADGVTTSIITVQAKDAQGNNLNSGGLIIALSENGSAIISAISDVGDGTYTATISSAFAESITISGTLNASPIIDTATVTFTPGSASATQTTISASPASVTADGLTVSIITVQTKDSLGNNLTSGGLTITLSENGNAVIGAITDVGNGTYTASMTNTVAETITVTGTVDATALTDSAIVTFTSGLASVTQTTISESSAIVIANGITAATITVQTKDPLGNNLTVGGAMIMLATSGSAALSLVTDNGDGTYTATITNTSLETVVVSGTLDGVAIIDTSSIAFTSVAVSIIETTITVMPVALIADGISSAVIIVQTKDSAATNLTGGGLTITLTQSGSAVLSSIIDLGDGTYTANISSTVAEQITVGATIEGITITDTDDVTFIAGPASLAQTLITGTPIAVVADGIASSAIIVQPRDVLGNYVSSGGLTVILSTTGSATLSATQDNGDGTYSATIASTTLESVTLTGTLDGNPIPDTATVTFTTGPISAINSTISASRPNVTADGNDTSVLTVQTYDILGNQLTEGGHTIVLTTNNNAVIGSVFDQLDGSYAASISNASVQNSDITGTIDGVPMTNTISVNFVAGGPAQVNTSDGRFANGVSSTGATIEIQDTLGNNLCTTTANLITGKYHCLITTVKPNGDRLTIITTNLAGLVSTGYTTINSIDTDDDGISDVVETLLSDAGGAANTQPDTDSDSDGLPDYSEILLGSDFLAIHSPVLDGNIDGDIDGMTDAVEFYFNAATNSGDSQLTTDTDGDGIPNFVELYALKSDFNRVNLPKKNGSLDSDNDGITDAVEHYLTSLSIVNVDIDSDYDRDGYSDALEVRLASSPLQANESDVDQDGVNDAIEAFLTGSINDGADTASIDSDNDGLPDIFELRYLDLEDLSNTALDLPNADTDGDGISDGVEQYLTGNITSAEVNQDSDADGITDIIELIQGSNPSRNSKPVVWIDVANLGGSSVDITARMGGHQAPFPMFSWDTSAILAIEPSAIIMNANNQALSINGLDPGKYSISLTITRTINTQTFSSTISQVFVVNKTETNDSDFDGISDAFDSHNGMMGAEESLHTAIGYNTFYKIQLQYGLGARIGLIARMGDNEVSTISNKQLKEYINQDFPITAGNTESNNAITSTANLFDVEVVNIPSTGDTVDIVIPLNRALSSSAAVLIFNHTSSNWSYMDTATTDNVSSTAGSPGDCPSPGDSSYSQGLAAGHYCLQLQVTDGGSNDSDTVQNGALPLVIGIGTSNYLPSSVQPNNALSNALADEAAVGYQTGNQYDSTPVDSSTEPSKGNSGGSINPLTLLFLIIASLNFSNRAYAAPAGGDITIGGGTIAEIVTGVDPDSGLNLIDTTIIQTTDRLGIEWDSFNITNGETVTFVQPSSTSIVLNQDFSGSISNIFGNINANGQVILLNSVGILIGENAQLNVGSFFASDLTPSGVNFNSDFNNSIGNFALSDSDTTSGGVINQGSIQTLSSSGTFIVGQFISNEGSILSSNGDTNLVIADSVVVSTTAGGILGVQILDPILNALPNTSELISNSGNIVALNGNIYLDLFYSDEIRANTVNNTGIINAVGITEGNGNVTLTASLYHIPPTESELDSVISEALPETVDTAAPAVEFELTTQPKVSLNSIMPDCNENDKSQGDEEAQDCSKYQAIKRYLGRLLLGGDLPDFSD